MVHVFGGQLLFPLICRWRCAKISSNNNSTRRLFFNIKFKSMPHQTAESSDTKMLARDLQTLCQSFLFKSCTLLAETNIFDGIRFMYTEIVVQPMDSDFSRRLSRMDGMNFLRFYRKHWMSNEILFFGFVSWHSNYFGISIENYRKQIDFYIALVDLKTTNCDKNKNT